ncbi:MAG: phosphotransferase [Pseudomonadota bacterium]
MEKLTGGREGILRAGSAVHRPTGSWTRQVHRLLQHVRHNGFAGAPEPLGFDEHGREMVSHIPGEVSNYPLSASASSLAALTSAATLLRRYHDATVGFLALPGALSSWQLPPRPPFEVVCHGDFAPYNVVLAGSRAIGIIDFDTAHPAPRVWDIAYALYRWAPLTNPNNLDGFGDVTAQASRAVAFCNAYGLEASARCGLITLVADRLQVLVDFMFAEARAGNRVFAANLSGGHQLLYAADIAYIRSNAERVEAALLRA